MSNNHACVLVFDIETVKDPSVMPADWDSSKWPPPLGWKVVAIGVLAAYRTGESYQVEKLACGVGEEARLLHDFWAFVDRRHPMMVSWNGRCFDVPVLLHRAMIHRVRTKKWFSGNGSARYGYRYSETGHCDLMDDLSEYGAVKSVSLDLISSALGFAGKDGKDGSQVEALYAEGRIDELRSYCEADVLNLYGVFLRWAHLTARLDDRGLDLSQQALSQYLSSEGGLLTCSPFCPRS
jgi:predicted PolB exonuclease-like 3'-5' exonuclease